MPSYVATFHTHLSAMLSARALEAAKAAEQVAMAPVPRRLSSSCGTCLRYTAGHPCAEHMDADLERIYEAQGGDEYRMVYQAQEP